MAYLCKKYNLNPKGTVKFQGVTVPVILDHAAANKLGLGSNHGDVTYWFNKFGKTLENVRNDVEALIKEPNVDLSKFETPIQFTPVLPEVGDLAKITGTKYYSGKDIPAWVLAKNWYVKSISGDRAVIDKSEDGKDSINSPININDLMLVVKAQDLRPKYEVQVTTTALNVRSGPSTSYSKVGVVKINDKLTITNEKAGPGSTKGWGYMGTGWVSLDYCKRI